MKIPADAPRGLAGTVLTLQGGPEVVLAFVNRANAGNLENKSRRAWACGTAIVAFVVGTLLLPVLGAPGFVLWFVAAWFTARFWRAGGGYVPEVHLPFLDKLFTVLRDDVAPGGLRLRCDLEPTESPGKQTAREGSWSSPRSVTRYEDPWFLADLDMADGNRIRLAIESSLVVKAKAKRRGSRKNYRGRHRLVVRVTADPAAYKGVLPPDQLVGTEVASFRVDSVTCEGHELRAVLFQRASSADPVAAASVLQVLTALYGLLVPLSRRERREWRASDLAAGASAGAVAPSTAPPA